MKNIKRWIYLAAIFALASCKYTASEVAPTVDTPEFAKPVILPLKLSAAKKIDWEKIKQMPLHPVAEKFDLHSLPSQTYDIVQVTPFLQPVQKLRFDYHALPESGLDIDKLPARPLKFKVSVLPKPKMKKAGPPRLKDSSMPVFEIGSMAQVFFGKMVSCVYKDRDGLLWIGTDRGLFRYDGENLFLYLTTTPPNPFNSIIQDELGQIWAGQYNVGISVLDIKNGLLKKVDETGGLNNTKIERLKEDDEHRIWIAYFPGAVNIIDQKEQIVKQLGRAEGLSDTTGIVGFTFDKHQRVGIGTYRGGFNIIDLHNKKIKYFNKAHGLSSDTVSAIFHDRSDRIWLTRNGRTVSVLDMKENVVQNIKTQHFGNMDASEMFEDLEGRVWISTFGNGLEIVDLAKNIYSQLTTANGLSSDIVINITGNGKDQLFLSTSQGLNCIENNSFVTQYVNRINTTAQVEDKQGLIWQATVYNGVNIIDRKAGVVRHLGAKDGLTNDTLQTIRQLDGKFFILSNRGFDIIDAEKQTITHLKRDKFTNSRPNSVVLDKTGRIWIGRNIGLDVYDLTGKWVKHIDNPEFNKAVIADLSRDSSGKIWVSPNTKGSISIIDPNKWNFRTIKNIDVINEKGIKALTTDKTGRMWIGTASGIYIANLADSTFVNITSRHGLIDNNVNSTLLYGDRAFVNTNSGLSVIKLPSTGVVSGVKLRIQSFGPNYGFEKSLQNYYETDMITRDGLYWWGDAGISVLDFSKKDTSVDPVFITGVNIMDQPKYFSNRSDSQRLGKNKSRSPGDNKHDLVKNVSKSKEQVVGMTWAGTSGPYDMPMDLELPYSQNFISFQYNNLNFIKRDTVWFSYILIGADKNWSDITSSPFTRNYINLQPGKYTFKVISKSRNGLWSKPAQLTFTINPPWWLTWWAYMIYICLFIA